MEGAAPTLPTSTPADLSQAAVDAAIAEALAAAQADEVVEAPEEDTVAEAPAAEEPAVEEVADEAPDDDAAFFAGRGEDVSPPVPEPEPVAAAPAPETLTAFLTRYGQYVALFVGAGLISGSVVHFPLAPVRYGLIGLVGGALFAAASAWAERHRPTPELVRVAASALALALGIGMVSGSIQHFGDIPSRAAVLIPIGLVLSLIAFMVRFDQRPRREELTAAIAWALVAMFVLFEGLGKLADTMTPAQAHHAPAAAEKPVATDDPPAGADAPAEHGH